MLIFHHYPLQNDDNNHNLKTDYEKLLNTYDNIYNNPAYHNIVAKRVKKVFG